MENSKRIIALLIFLLSSPLFLNAGNNPNGTKNILYISSYSNTFPTFAKQVSGIESVFEKYDNINVNYEFMYSRDYINTPEDIKLFSDLLKYRLDHAVYPVDLVMVADDDAFNFALDRRYTLFKGLPIVFLGVNDLKMTRKFNHDPQFTGIAEDVSIDKTVEMMLKLFPNKKEIYVICDGTVTGLATLKRFFEYASAIQH